MTSPVSPPLDYLVRLARAGDIDAIQKTAQESWFKTYDSILPRFEIETYLARSYARSALTTTLKKTGETFLVAIHDDQVLGFCHFGERGRGAEIFQLYVAPDSWGRGIGRRLVSHVEMHFMSLGFARYGLTVHRRNARAILFYDRLGFEHVAEKDQGPEWAFVKPLI